MRYLRGDTALDERVFMTVLSIGVVAAAFTCLLSVVLDLGLSQTARIVGAVCAVWFALLQYFSYRFPKRQYTFRIVLVCGLSFVFFPFAFLSAGGAYSGMQLLYMLGIFNIITLLKRPLRGILVYAQVLLDEFTIYLSQHYPQYFMQLQEQQRYLIAKLILFICCITLANILALVLTSYESERERSRKLTDQLSVLSTRDPLTGLYNRRELFRRLELVFQPDETRTEHDRNLVREGCYISMFDVDNFKHLNDTFGHHFGDVVLSTVAKHFSDAVTHSDGELAARYGGEEFVIVLYAASLGEAFARLDTLRQSIDALEWSDSPHLRVTVSGGVVPCIQYDELDRAMHDVDALLYQAKHDGKNRIETQLHSAYPQKRA